MKAGRGVKRKWRKERQGDGGGIIMYPVGDLPAKLDS